MDKVDLPTGYKSVGDGIVYNKEWDETVKVKKSEIKESEIEESGAILYLGNIEPPKKVFRRIPSLFRRNK